MRLELDPTIGRVALVAILIFIYALTAQSGITAILIDRMPEPNEWLYFIFIALGTDVVYMLTFLGITKPENEHQ